MSGYSKFQFNFASLLNFFYSKLLFIKIYELFNKRYKMKEHNTREIPHNSTVNEYELWNGERIQHNSIRCERLNKHRS